MDDFMKYSSGRENFLPPDLEKEAKNLAQKYNGKNENELMRDIFSRAAEQKRQGTLTNEQIDNFYRQFAPMLDAVKRKKLQKLISQLKNM